MTHGLFERMGVGSMEVGQRRKKWNNCNSINNEFFFNFKRLVRVVKAKYVVVLITMMVVGDDSDDNNSSSKEPRYKL